jgi:hypothetical protein
MAAPGCLPYLYHERDPALIEGIDIDQTLDVAEAELEDPDAFSVLTIWAIRDQEITPVQARRISALYLDSIEAIDSEEMRGRKFAVWHFTWAIANLYRFGDPQVRGELAYAHADAWLRVDGLDRSYAEEHVKGDEMYTGLAHGGGVSFAERHLVVPGNEDYLQSFEEYLEAERD